MCIKVFIKNRNLVAFLRKGDHIIEAQRVQISTIEDVNALPEDKRAELMIDLKNGIDERKQKDNN